MSQTDYFNGSTNNRQQMEQSFKKIAFILELQVRNKTRYDGKKKTAELKNRLSTDGNQNSFEYELDGFIALNFSKGESLIPQSLTCSTKTCCT